MLVNMISLRCDGVKRPKDEVLAASPLRAELRVQRLPGGLCAQLLFPWLGPLSPGTKVPTLQECRIQRLTGDDIVLVGLEAVGMHHERRQVPQAWWCRLAQGPTAGAVRAGGERPGR